MNSSQPQVIQPPPDNTERTRQGSTSSSQIVTIRSPVSTIAVLPSSLPDYHKAYMSGQPRPPTSSHDSEGMPMRAQNDEEKAAQARRLRPNFRTTPDPHRQRPEPLTALPPKKPKPTRWQFGIRSRNQPAEAMLAIYKALHQMGAEWEVPKIRRPGSGSRSRSRSQSPDSVRSSDSLSRSPERHSGSSGDDYEHSDRDMSPDHREPLRVRNSTDADGFRPRGRQRRHYDHNNDWGYKIPKDPWVINARFRKDGMYPPGVMQPSSTNSSRADLQEAARRRSSTTTSHSSHSHADASATTGAATVAAAATDRSRAGSVASDSPSVRYSAASSENTVYVYMSIQLYSIERDFFVVDFKCAGYERLVNSLVREIKATSASNNTSVSNLTLEHQQHSQNQGQHTTTHQHHHYPRHHHHHGHQEGWDDEQGVWRRLGPDGEGVPEEVARELRGMPEDLQRELREGGRQVEWREWREERGVGRAQGEKKATSPFPFLDVASALILQLSGD